MNMFNTITDIDHSDMLDTAPIDLTSAETWTVLLEAPTTDQLQDLICRVKEGLNNPDTVQSLRMEDALSPCRTKLDFQTSATH